MTQQHSHLCSECGEPHFVKLAHKETLNKHKLVMLKAAAEYIKRTGVNDFPKAELDQSANNYSNFQKLRYHGLVHHVRNKDGSRKRGHWLITRNGWAFLRGELELPKYVLVKDNSITSRADTKLNVRDVYHGSDTITTLFEYFDDDGNMVGLRPLHRPGYKPQQEKLL